MEIVLLPVGSSSRKCTQPPNGSEGKVTSPSTQLLQLFRPSVRLRIVNQYPVLWASLGTFVVDRHGIRVDGEYHKVTTLRNRASEKGDQ